MTPKLEIVVEDAEGAGITAAAGVDSIELCADLAQGGLTPAPSLMRDVGNAVARVAPAMEYHVLILNRPDGFVPAPADVEELVSGIVAARQAGATGVVFGALTPEGTLNLPVLEKLVAASAGMKTTFHRAFDRITNQAEAMEQLITLGFDRLLTSGRPGKAPEHIPVLAGLVRQAGTRLHILAGGGIRAANFLDVGRGAQPHYLHLSCREPDPVQPSRFRTNPKMVQEIIALKRRL